MAYATKQDLIDRYGENELARLTDRAAGTTVNDTVVDRALADASAEIDSYLAKRATTPLSPMPGLVVTHCCAIARYYLHEDHAPDRVKDAYKLAIDWLKLAARGDVTVDGVTPAQDAPSADMPLVEGPERIFGRDSMRLY